MGDLPVLDHDDAVADGEEFGELRRDEEDRLAVVREARIILRISVLVPMSTPAVGSSRIEHLGTRCRAIWRGRPSAGCHR